MVVTQLVLQIAAHTKTNIDPESFSTVLRGPGWAICGYEVIAAEGAAVEAKKAC